MMKAFKVMRAGQIAYGDAMIDAAEHEVITAWLVQWLIRTSRRSSKVV